MHICLDVGSHLANNHCPLPPLLQPVNKFQNCTDLAKVDHVVHEAQALHDRLSKADKDASTVNPKP
jgi:hypothetical protein